MEVTIQKMDRKNIAIATVVVVAIAVMVVGIMSPRLIVDSNPAVSVGRRALSLVNIAEVVGHC